MSGGSRCLYIHTLVKLLHGRDRPLEALPTPVVLSGRNAIIQEIPTSLLDNRILIIPLQYDFPSLDVIQVRAERVGGKLNGIPIELGIREITVRDGDLHIPFFALEQPYPPGRLDVYHLEIGII